MQLSSEACNSTLRLLLLICACGLFGASPQCTPHQYDNNIKAALSKVAMAQRALRTCGMTCWSKKVRSGPFWAVSLSPLLNQKARNTAFPFGASI